MEGKRLFIAINLPEKIKEQLGRVIAQLERRGDPIKFEPAEKLHLTLKFLGHTDKVSIIRYQVLSIAKRYRPFYLSLSNIDYFCDGHFVLYIGLIGPIRDIWEQIEKSCKELGFPREKSEFTGHITIGRGKGRQPKKVWRKIGEKLKKIKLPKFEKFLAESVDMMESELTKEGSVYRVVALASLKGN